MGSTFVNVQVEEHDELPDGCCLRFRAQSAARRVEEVTYESETGTGGTWRVEGRTAGGAVTPATAFEVDDSSAGTSLLVVGGEHGLRLTSVTTGETVAEAYLLLSLSSALARAPTPPAT
jgi:hypothetical protein